MSHLMRLAKPPLLLPHFSTTRAENSSKYVDLRRTNHDKTTRDWRLLACLASLSKTAIDQVPKLRMICQLRMSVITSSRTSPSGKPNRCSFGQTQARPGDQTTVGRISLRHEPSIPDTEGGLCSSATPAGGSPRVSGGLVPPSPRHVTRFGRHPIQNPPFQPLADVTPYGAPRTAHRGGNFRLYSSLLASHQGEQCSIPGRDEPRIFAYRIVLSDAAGKGNAYNGAGTAIEKDRDWAAIVPIGTICSSFHAGFTTAMGNTSVLWRVWRDRGNFLLYPQWTDLLATRSQFVAFIQNVARCTLMQRSASVLDWEAAVGNTSPPVRSCQCRSRHKYVSTLAFVQPRVRSRSDKSESVSRELSGLVAVGTRDRSSEIFMLCHFGPPAAILDPDDVDPGRQRTNSREGIFNYNFARAHSAFKNHFEGKGATPARLPPRRSGFDPRPGHSGSSHVGIVPDDAVGRRVFSEISRFPALLHVQLTSPTSALKTSLLRAVEISSLTLRGKCTYIFENYVRLVQKHLPSCEFDDRRLNMSFVRLHTRLRHLRTCPSLLSRDSSPALTRLRHCPRAALSRESLLLDKPSRGSPDKVWSNCKCETKCTSVSKSSLSTDTRTHREFLQSLLPGCPCLMYGLGRAKMTLVQRLAIFWLKLTGAQVTINNSRLVRRCKMRHDSSANIGAPLLSPREGNNCVREGVPADSSARLPATCGWCFASRSVSLFHCGRRSQVHPQDSATAVIVVCRCQVKSQDYDKKGDRNITVIWMMEVADPWYGSLGVDKRTPATIKPFRRLDYSPPTWANRVRFPEGLLQDFRMCESCRKIPLIGGDLPFPQPYIPALQLTHLTSPSSALKTSTLRAYQISALHSTRGRMDLHTSEDRLWEVVLRLGKASAGRQIWLLYLRGPRQQATPLLPLIAISQTPRCCFLAAVTSVGDGAYRYISLAHVDPFYPPHRIERLGEHIARKLWGLDVLEKKRFCWCESVRAFEEARRGKESSCRMTCEEYVSSEWRLQLPTMVFPY
ncbi:hypothetical protein PR048_022420 [Dryococelus australis]|uniref:Uncharacterized protein n=1 Tax=Dryococelus australis TaxID=614101 RepID=A0ABQ9H128_9NEOP|nr:hypothetical protein PR048_022420 [Dryococelus australis]